MSKFNHGYLSGFFNGRISQMSELIRVDCEMLQLCGNTSVLSQAGII